MDIQDGGGGGSGGGGIGIGVGNSWARRENGGELRRSLSVCSAREIQEMTEISSLSSVPRAHQSLPREKSPRRVPESSSSGRVRGKRYIRRDEMQGALPCVSRSMRASEIIVRNRPMWMPP